MLEKFSVAIAKRLCSNLSIADEQYEACCYGCETLLHTILSTLGLIIIGLCSHMVTETLTIITIFYINQTFGGGFHATSHVKCFLTMVLFLMLGLFFCRLPQNLSIDISLLIPAIVILFLNPLILHKNKKYLAKRTAFFVKRSHLINSLWVSTVVLCIVLQTFLIRPIAVGLTLSAVSRLAARWKVSH